MNAASSPRLFWPDLMRAVAMALVVLVHVSGAVLNAGYGATGAAGWWFAAFVGSLGRCGAPLFFMLSGALLVGKAQAEPARAFLSKRMGKIIIPFIAWSLVYTLVKALRHQTALCASTWISLLSQPAYYHLWFFYSITGLYLFAPLFRFADRGLLRYVMLFWSMAVPCAFFLTGLFHFSIDGNFTGILPVYIGYFAGGYLLRDATLKKELRMKAGVVFAGALSVTVLGMGLLTRRAGGGADAFFFDYRNINVAAMTFSLFILLRAAGEKGPGKFPGAMVRTIGTCSLGIYALHPLILELFDGGTLGMRLSAFTFGPLAGIPLTFLAAMACATACVFLVMKVPLARRCV